MNQYVGLFEVEWSCVNKQCGVTPDDLILSSTNWDIGFDNSIDTLEEWNKIAKDLQKRLHDNLQQYVGKKVTADTLKEACSDVLDALHYTMGGFRLDTAQGEQLDELAKMHGLKRISIDSLTEPDDMLRERILILKGWK